MTPRGVLAFCREKEVKAIDLRFTDFAGTWQHITVPVSRLSEASFENGFPVDTTSHFGSNAYDRLIVPQASSIFLDPFASIPTLILIGIMQDPITREDDTLDSRIIADRARLFLQGTGIADRAKIASTCEFILFEDATCTRIGLSANDPSFDFRNCIMESMLDANIPVAQHFQCDRVANISALEIDSSEFLSAADAVMSARYIIRSGASHRSQFASFLPNSFESGHGSGMPIRLSLWKGDEPLFGGQGYGGISDMALLSIGGILHHAPALAAFCNPTPNSYQRLHHASEQLFQIGFSQHSRKTVCRIPPYNSDPRNKCIAFQTPDSSANPYLAFAAILMAAIDGIQNKIEPGTPMSSDSHATENSKTLPPSLWDALDCLEKDSDFLLRGEVFSKEMLETYLDFKRNVERPIVESFKTPGEYQQYYDG